MLKRVQSVRPELNITSMLDVVFNLITFFILITNFAAASLPQLTPPEPDKSVASQPTEKNTVTINVLPYPKEQGKKGEPYQIKFGMSTFGAEDLENRNSKCEKTLVEFLGKEITASKDVAITLRVDRDIKYAYVEKIILVIRQAGVQKIQIVAAVRE